FFIDDEGFRRGKPGAHWEKVRMNNLGMRGADVSATAVPGCKRLMFMGASESFGEPSVANHEFPAKVRALLQRMSCVEILNTAFPGLHPSEMAARYRYYLAKYK